MTQPRRSKTDPPEEATRKEKPRDQQPQSPPADVVDEASDESFPASDPPAWTETAASKDEDD